jgi:hypothetical protein
MLPLLKTFIEAQQKQKENQFTSINSFKTNEKEEKFPQATSKADCVACVLIHI